MQKSNTPISLLLLACALLVSSATLSAAPEAPPAQNAFFAFDNGVGRGSWPPQVQAETLKQIGYAGIGYSGTAHLAERRAAFDTQGLKIFSLYVPCYLDRTPAYAPDLLDAIEQLSGSGTMIWLTVQGKGNDQQTTRIIQEIADAAQKHSVNVALYPHHGFHVATTGDALRLLKQVDRKNVGVSINLCHELRAGNATKLGDIIVQAAPHLFLVSINGADNEGPGWDKLIQPLGKGNFDVATLLQQLNTAGYSGPIGLQCYNVKGDKRENLKRSLEAWEEIRTPK